ncbi:MAG TPA: 16S rRNA (guanine(527)-N(7))-methyltransferase RsmG [Bacteroidales bacterium]|nr:16S rRNA (guanine(527)-N(7))-methyltransferase RsmG [Bacteroidales bacterium]
MDIIQKYFPGLSSKQQDQFSRLQDLYEDLNRKINVISRKDIDNLYERHVLHSLAIARVISFNPGAKILDAGTGGGFPGIPLAVLFPETRFHLVDSVGKKIRGVQQIADELGLKHVTTQQIRMEDVGDTFDFIVSRAVATIPQMLEWTRGKIKSGGQHTLPNGLLYLKGGDFSNELQTVNLKYSIWQIQDFFEEEFFKTKKLIHLW